MFCKKEASAFKAVEKERQRHGSSRAQATTETPGEARKQQFLRNFLKVHPEPQSLFCIPGLSVQEVEPSDSYIKFLRRFQKELNIAIAD